LYLPPEELVGIKLILGVLVGVALITKVDDGKSSDGVELVTFWAYTSGMTATRSTAPN
jgi:hypothetical protein